MLKSKSGKLETKCISNIKNRYFVQYLANDLVTAAQFWNSLPDNVTSANSLSAFRQQLKHTLFQQ